MQRYERKVWKKKWVAGYAEGIGTLLRAVWDGNSAWCAGVCGADLTCGVARPAVDERAAVP
eukprot:3244514-Rhodomonas_salina.3